MADVVYQTDSSQPKLINWSAIWAGLFTFVGIWSVFGLLGLAIFAPTAGASTMQPTVGTSVGLGIWTIVLAAVAMYVAGRQTGRFAATSARQDGLAHGMIMFGLAVTSAVVLTLSGRILFTAIPAAEATLRSPYLLRMFAGSGWFAFVALFLGWLAAMLGASTGGRQKLATTSNVKDIRPAA